MINLSDVHLVLEIAKAGSISKAASNLFMSQPNLSKKLKRFESDLGLELFERSGSGIKLTYDGRKFVDAASSIYDDLQILEKSITEKKILNKMELNIASTSFYFMRPAIAELCSHYPHIPLTLKYTEVGNEEQISLISKGRLEIGIISVFHREVDVMRKMAKLHGVEYHTLCRAKAYIAVSENSKRYPASIKGLDYDRLKEMFLITISPFGGVIKEGESSWSHVNRILGKRNEQPGLWEVGTNNTGTAHELLSLMDGFTIVLENEGILRRYGHFENIRLIALPNAQDTYYEIGWLQLANTVRRPLANEFINLLSSYATAK